MSFLASCGSALTPRRALDSSGSFVLFPIGEQEDVSVRVNLLIDAMEILLMCRKIRDC